MTLYILRPSETLQKLVSILITLEYAQGSFGGIQSLDARPNDVTGISQKKQCTNGGMKVPHPLFWEMYYIHHSLISTYPTSLISTYPPLAHCLFSGDSSDVIWTCMPWLDPTKCTLLLMIKLWLDSILVDYFEFILNLAFVENCDLFQL